MRAWNWSWKKAESGVGGSGLKTGVDVFPPPEPPPQAARKTEEAIKLEISTMLVKYFRKIFLIS